MSSFLDMLKQANESKNKQAHRIVPGTKAARKHLAKSTKDTYQTTLVKPVNTKAAGRGS